MERVAMTPLTHSYQTRMYLATQLFVRPVECMCVIFPQRSHEYGHLFSHEDLEPEGLMGSDVSLHFECVLPAIMSTVLDAVCWCPGGVGYRS